MKHWLRAFLIALAFMTLAGLSSCDESLAYSHYEHTQLAGWEKSDTLYFNTPRITRKGRYRIELGLRTTGDYPFTSLTLNIEQCVFPQKSTKSHSIKCQLMEENGVTKGQGVSIYQYAFPVTDIDLNEGDSVEIRIRHDMKRETLPGIADVGIKLSRK